MPEKSKEVTSRIYHGRAEEELAQIPDASVDSIVTDPPAGISFMGKSWDAAGQRGSGRKVIRERQSFVGGLTVIFEECLRVLKPGGHAVVWALPRTSHWTATALEDAGFEVRDVVTHHFGTGFPKSLDVSKAIDKAAGAEREVVGYRKPEGSGIAGTAPRDSSGSHIWSGQLRSAIPATSEAQTWEGFGTSLKPASEHWILARKPLEGTVAANVLEHGTGAINVDGCRVVYATEIERDLVKNRSGAGGPKGVVPIGGGKSWKDMKASEMPVGRWPANLLLTHALACEQIGTREVVGDPRGDQPNCTGTRPEGFAEPGAEKGEQIGTPNARVYGDEEVEEWLCSPGCPIAELDGQSGTSKSTGGMSTPQHDRDLRMGRTSGEGSNAGGIGDTGGASRFFPTFRYQAKASTRERNEGLPEGDKNLHPTVKSVELMRWLVCLVTPPGGLVLDPFTGSGTTGVAAELEGLRFIGVEQDESYRKVALARLFRAETDRLLFS